MKNAININGIRILLSEIVAYRMAPVDGSVVEVFCKDQRVYNCEVPTRELPEYLARLDRYFDLI